MSSNLIFRSKDIYSTIKEVPKIVSEEDFFNKYKPKKGSQIITDEMLESAFSDLRIAFGQNFKLDNICFFFGNGCSLYAGSKSTTEFKIIDAVDSSKIEIISDIAEIIKEHTLEEQLNELITVQNYYSIIDKEKASKIEDIIKDIKSYLIKKYVNSVKYDKLILHEVMLMKLRSFGCLSKVKFFTTNYDMALEYVMDKMGIEYANGFTGFVNRKFDPKSFQNTGLTQLIKIHGSVNWIYDEKDKVIKEVQPNFSQSGNVKVTDSKHVLIYPTEEKLYQTYRAPYSELMRNMLDCFESKRNVIIVMGYRYSDEHLNEILFKAVANPNNIFYFFDYGDGSCDFIQRMMEISRNANNINIFLGRFLGDFETFVKFMLPANAERTDEERIFELLNKAMEKHVEEDNVE